MIHWVQVDAELRTPRDGHCRARTEHTRGLPRPALPDTALADTYIHRNGRTARANAAGFSMLMCAPD
ncbi:hypothetical protein EV122DRAFT_267597, partial [Schizophyllum commune]